MVERKAKKERVTWNFCKTPHHPSTQEKTKKFGKQLKLMNYPFESRELPQHFLPTPFSLIIYFSLFSPPYFISFWFSNVVHFHFHLWREKKGFPLRKIEERKCLHIEGLYFRLRITAICNFLNFVKLLIFQKKEMVTNDILVILK